MKYIPLSVILISTIGVMQAHSTTVLENDAKDAVYIPQHVLNSQTSHPNISRMVEVSTFPSVQVNVDGQGMNVMGDAANEPSIAVNPLNPQQIAIGWRQFDSISSSFRQAGWSHSSDGGQTWGAKQVIEPGVFRSDPVLAANADGEFYYQSLGVELDGQGEPDDFFIDQWKSYDGGATWVEKTFAFGGDKSWYAVDRSNRSTRGNIYAAWNIAGNRYTPNTYNASLDNGNSFTQPIELPRRPIFGTVEVGAQGEVYVFGVSDFVPPQFPGFPFLIKTNDPDRNRPNFSQVTQINMGGKMRLGSFVNPVGLVGQLYVRVDKSERASRGTVHLLGSLQPNFGGDPLNMMYVRSTDGGQQFTDPRALGLNSSQSWQWFGTAAVAPNGRLDVIWYDTQNDDGSVGNARSSRLYYTYSYDAGMTFAREEAISPRFNHFSGYPVQRKMGDYIDMVSDNRGAHIAYTATYNGEQDVYYVFAQPSAVEENPDLPSLMTNNAWVAQGVPSQGILSSTLLDSSNVDNPLLAFDAIFTATPQGQPMWLVATGSLPSSGDEVTLPVFMPTGDLSHEGQAILAIGTLTKKRLRDDNNELLDNVLQYVFDMSDAVRDGLQSTLGSQYDETFFVNNPFYGTQKTLTFESLLPRGQVREDLCNINGQVLQNREEMNEGRVQFTFRRDNSLEVFAADFSYLKTVDESGNEQLVLNDQGLAQPIWFAIQSDEQGVQQDQSVHNRIFSPNGGLGFFQSGEDPGTTEVGTEQVTVDGNELITVKPNLATEVLSILANNAYCGSIQ